MLALSAECSVLVVYTAKETNSKVNGKLQDTQFRICGGLPNTSSCKKRTQLQREWDGTNRTLRSSGVQMRFILQKYLGIIRKTHVSQNCGYVS